MCCRRLLYLYSLNKQLQFINNDNKYMQYLPINSSRKCVWQINLKMTCYTTKTNEYRQQLISTKLSLWAPMNWHSNDRMHSLSFANNIQNNLVSRRLECMYYPIRIIIGIDEHWLFIFSHQYISSMLNTIIISYPLILLLLKKSSWFQSDIGVNLTAMNYHDRMFLVVQSFEPLYSIPTVRFIRKMLQFLCSNSDYCSLSM